MKKIALILTLIVIPFLKSFSQYTDSLKVSISSKGMNPYEIPIKLCLSTVVLNNNFKWDYKNYTITLNKQMKVQRVVSNNNKDVSTLATDEKQLLEEIKKLCLELRSKHNFESQEQFESKVKNFFLADELILQVSVKNIRNMVWDITEEMPEFNHEDYPSFLDYIAKNIDPEVVNRVGLEGKLFIEFIVTHEGKIGDVKVVKSLHPKLDMEAIRVIKNSPLWKPGKQRRTPTNVRFMYPVRFE